MFNWKGHAQRDEPAILDESYLRRLAEHLGDDTLRELMCDGLIELVDRVNTVDALAEAGDGPELAKVVHDIAGMAGHLGLSRLSSTAVTAERELRGPAVPSDVAFSLINDEAPKAIAALRDFLDGTGAS